MLIAFQKIMKKYIIPSLLSMSLFLVSVMALTLSIPKIVKAATQISAFTDFTRTYNGYDYKFYTVGQNDPPSGYSFNSDVIDYVIETCGKAQRYQIENRSNIVPVAWAQEQAENLFNLVFGVVLNAYIATRNVIHDNLVSSTATYSWNFEFTGSDETYPGWDTYGTAYGFRFTGATGDVVDLTLDSQGDFYGHNPIGNYTINPDPEPYNWILINQGLDNFYTPVSNVEILEDLPAPYIQGEDLYFYAISNGVTGQYRISNFANKSLAFYKTNLGQGFLCLIDLGNNPSYVSTIYYPSGVSYSFETSSFSRYENWRSYLPSSTTGTHTNYKHQFFNNSVVVTVNLPTYFLPSQTINEQYIYQNNSLGFVNNQTVSGFGDIYLNKIPYNVNPSPNPVPETPIPVTEIPSDPDDPIPSSNPDPVPGITYPVNPTPPPLRPVPSIVSGNDDLWPSVIQLQDIELDLSGYISGLGEYTFPDLSVITESFAGSIVWVSALMSTLFNGSDFSILFAVLSSFFIVAALLGLYKWWNHK